MLLTILLVLNALIGAAMLEFAWSASSRHREVNEERDKNFPAWRRLDAHKWSKWAMYPLAVTVLPIRGILFIVSLGFI
jgi:hypothetical protein